MRYVYTVKEGDTLAAIAKKYHTSEQTLKTLNNLKDEIFEGMKLLAEKQSVAVHTVMPFEDIKTLAVKFGCKEEDLERLNGSAVFFIGQTVYYPLKEIR